MKNITKRIRKNCAVCGKKIAVIIYNNKSYRGGHYFGKIPLYSKGEWDKAVRGGTRKTRLGAMVVDVLKKDPKPYKYAEYWECPKCYLG